MLPVMCTPHQGKRTRFPESLDSCRGLLHSPAAPMHQPILAQQSTCSGSAHWQHHDLSIGHAVTYVAYIAACQPQVLSSRHCLAAGDKPGLRSPVTSHMLDTAAGRPAEGVPIRLERLCTGSSSAWEALGEGCTNADGRVGDLLPPSDFIQAGTYR